MCIISNSLGKVVVEELASRWNVLRQHGLNAGGLGKLRHLM